MLSPAQVAVIIPCFNEARFIADLVKATRKQLPGVIVVDDHSSDTTADSARQAGAVVLTNPQQLGKGGSLLRGLEAAHAKGFEWALLMDGDGQHSPGDIPKFLCGSVSSLVIGNRMHASEAMPWLRRQVNRWMSRMISGLAGCEVPDSQCGFRLIHLPAWKSVPLETRQFEIESEMVVAFARAGFSVSFVPIEVIYRNEQSKIRPLSDTIRWFRWYFRARQKLRAGRTTKPSVIAVEKSAPMVP